MDIITNIMLGFFLSGMLTVCLGLYKISNGRLSKKVSEDTCGANVDNMHKRFDDLQRAIETRFDDLKSFIKNGE